MLPQMMLSMNEMIEDGSASRLRNGFGFGGSFSDAMAPLFLNFVVMTKAHRDMPAHARKGQRS